MSQHQIHVDSPKVGQVLVTVGYDPMQDEAFLNYVNDNFSYMSDPGLAVSEIQRLAIEQLGMQLPQPVIDGVQADMADLRIGARDIGRRITQYEADGSIAEAVKF